MTHATLQHFHCPPGTKVILQITGMEEKLISACVGHVRNRFFIVQMPPMTEAGRDTLYPLLYPDNRVIVRYLHEGTVVGFSAGLIKSIQIPFPLIFLTYPKKLESHDLRKHPRVSCCIPAQIIGTNATLPGLILDLSTSGCQFSSTCEDKASEFSIDDAATLHCDLFGPDARDQVPCAVKRVALSGKRLELGLKFQGVPDAVRKSLEAYLDEAIAILG